MTPVPAIVLLSARGLGTAARLRAVLPEAELWGLAARIPESEADILFDDVGDTLRALFRAGRPIVAPMAAGIVIRALAPALEDKTTEPPVVVVAEDGSAVVPLLGGHHGANELAQTIAGRLGVHAAITTAGDLAFGLALDAPPPGWRLANPDDVKPFVAALLAGEAVRLDGTAPWLSESDLPFADGGALDIVCTTKERRGGAQRLVYHPAQVAVGVGAERGCATSEVVDLIRASLVQAGVSALAVAGLFSLDIKEDEAAFHAAADALGVPFRVFDAARLRQEDHRLATPSDAVAKEVGLRGVAEAAALAAAGPAGELILPKQKSRRATCALASGPGIIDVATTGHAQGRLFIVGLGPGQASWRTGEAAAAIRASRHLVGYRRYLDLIGETGPEQQLHGYDLGAEEKRVRDALDLAAGGEAVALVSSGDPGIYAMASLVFEAIDTCPQTASWRRIAVAVVPGLSAMQAAAARAGAPLGHDFCAISLSDLLTPKEVILRRLQAAAQGDFVTALYNPVSATRRELLGEAKAILLQQRSRKTPVILARQLGRTGENVRIITLAELEVDAVDMLTLVIIGASQTRAFERRPGATAVYTPRGYAVGERDEAAL